MSEETNYQMKPAEFEKPDDKIQRLNSELGLKHNLSDLNSNASPYEPSFKHSQSVLIESESRPIE